jgi:hypothetical protein
VLSVVQEKLNNPSPEDPFEPDIAAVGIPPNSPLSLGIAHFKSPLKLLKEDKSKFLSIAKDWTVKYV